MTRIPIKQINTKKTTLQMLIDEHISTNLRPNRRLVPALAVTAEKILFDLFCA